MPPTRTAALVTDAYRRRLVDLRDSTALAVAALLESVDLDASPAALSRDLARWQERSRVLATASGARAAAQSAGYLSAYLVASGAQPLSVDVPLAEPDTAGLRVVQGALFWRLGQGAGRALALRTATATARRVARDVVGRAASRTLAEGIRREPQIDGWQRATSGSSCKRCAGLTGVKYRDRDDFDQAHPACRCTPEPAVFGRPETVRRQSPTVVSP